MRNPQNLLFQSLVISLGGLLFGYDTAVINGALPFMIEEFDLANNEWLQSQVSGSVIIGCVLGAIFGGKAGDQFGRKKTLMVCALLFLVSALGSAFARGAVEMIVYRIIGGVGVGVASIISPVFISEISPADKRGKLVAINQFTIILGIFLALLINYLIIDWENNWRWMMGMETIPALSFFIGLFFVAESKRWEGIRSNIQSNSTVQVFKKLLTNKKLKFLLLIGIFLASFQQLTGYDIILYYSSLIFTKVGFSADDALFNGVLIGLINMIFTILSMVLIDKWGRRPIALLGSLVMGISLILVWFFMGVAQVNPWLSVVSVLIYVAAFSFSLGPVVWVIISELFPDELRGIAVSICVFFMWTSGYLLISSFPFLSSFFKGLGNEWYSFLVYAAFCIINFIFILVFIEETKGKQLEKSI